MAGPPGTDYHRLSADQHRWVFDELIALTYLARPLRRAATHTDPPVVVYLVGEPGAGQLLASRMLCRATRPGTVRVDPDDLRGTHLRGRFRPMFHPDTGCLVGFFGSRQEMVFSPV
ncbi:zeta toxin family protein, partial [Streptomyces sp. NPDC057686]|uniref:zeta toxin family protein n=1 Tax=Streptomyces sp. NPDC057686 TaxID=3346212 RepID=UPI003693FBB3